MAINIPGSNLPAGDLARCKTTELNDEWPVSLEIVAYFGEHKRRRKSVVISAAEFFGRDGFNAPMTGDMVIGLIERLRRGRG